MTGVGCLVSNLYDLISQSTLCTYNFVIEVLDVRMYVVDALICCMTELPLLSGAWDELFGVALSR